MNQKTAIICSAFLAMRITATADTFVLKDGSKLEGKIVSEKADSYVLEVQVTKSIKDERVVAKADVVSVERTKPDLIAFESIAPLSTIPDMLTPADYNERIARLKEFTNEHLSSEKFAEANAMVSKHKRELALVEAGGIKVNGQMLSATEYQADAVDVDASVAERRVLSLLKGARFLEALRAFSAFDSEFPNTKQRKELFPLILPSIRQYIASAEQDLASYSKRVSEQQAGLTVMQAEERRKTEAAIRAENASFETRLKREKEAKVGWISPNPMFKPSLDEALNFGRQELKRLSDIPVLPPPDAGKAYRDAMQSIRNSEDKTAITAAIATAKAAMVTPKYLSNLEAAAANVGK